MNRADLEALDRDTLVSKAEAAGVLRPAVLTRPELVDELLVRTAKDKQAPEVKRARGFFGIARDLLARVIERGLNLPEAADLLRAEPAPARPVRSTSSVIPTVTLAEIYATQGHKARAEETLRKVLEAEPDHEAARLLLERLQSADLPAPKFAPESDDADADADAEKNAIAETSEKQADSSPAAEPLGMLDDAPLPPKYDVDECVAIAVDPKTIFVYWEIRDETRRRLERTRPGGYVALRLLIIEGTWDGPRTTSRDVEVHTSIGDWFMRDLPPGAVVRAAIGWQTADAFVPVAHSPALEAQPNAPSPLIAEGLIRWTPEGVPVRISESDRDATSIAHALGRVQEIERQRGRRGGSSELYALPSP